MLGEADIILLNYEKWYILHGFFERLFRWMPNVNPY